MSSPPVPDSGRPLRTATDGYATTSSTSHHIGAGSAVAGTQQSSAMRQSMMDALSLVQGINHIVIKELDSIENTGKYSQIDPSFAY